MRAGRPFASGEFRAWAGERILEMLTSLRGVSERFPHVRERAAELFEEHETFRELCEEYEMCRMTACRLVEDSESSEALRNEYAALCLRLEGELLRYLEHPNRGIPVPQKK